MHSLSRLRGECCKEPRQPWTRNLRNRGTPCISVYSQYPAFSTPRHARPHSHTHTHSHSRTHEHTHTYTHMQKDRDSVLVRGHDSYFDLNSWPGATTSSVKSILLYQFSVFRFALYHTASLSNTQHLIIIASHMETHVASVYSLGLLNNLISAYLILMFLMSCTELR